MLVDTAAVAVGRILGQHLARAWLSGRSAERDRGKDLVELTRTRFPDRIARRRFERQIADIADQVAERLLGLLDHEYGGLRRNDKAAVLAEVKETLAAADLSDRVLFSADVDPIHLAMRLRADMPRRGSVAQLGEAGARLYDVVLDECCGCFVRIVQQVPQFGPRATTEALARLSGLADEVSRLLDRLPVRTLDAPEGAATDEIFRQRYLEHLVKTLNVLELFGVRIERYRPRTTLSVAYISLSVSTGMRTASKEPASRRLHIDEWRESDQEASEATMRVERAFSRTRLMLIRGEAGSGKSTLLRWLAISAARSAFTADLAEWNGYVPFLIKLRSYTDSALPLPERFLEGSAGPIAGQMPASWVHRLLRGGRVLLLVDGVDEMPGAQRRSVRPWLNSLLTEYPAIRVVVTSRPAAAGSDWLAAEGFSTAFLERMTPADVKELVRHWHAAVRDAGDLPCPPEQLPAYEAALLARLESAPHLRALAGSPLLAAMLCALNLDREKQLPRDRMGLYAAALELLLERRDIERQIPADLTLERPQKMQILQALAWRLSITGRTELPKDAVVGWTGEKLAMMPNAPTDGAAALDHLIQRSGVVREPIPGRIDFVHRTVQEYLTAKQFTDDGDLEPLIAQAHKDQWRETIIMAAGHANAPQREELVRGLLQRISEEPRQARRLQLLVAGCLETLPVIPPSLRDQIEATVNDLVPPRGLTAARSLSTIGEPFLSRLPRSLDGLTAAAARAVVRTAWLINGPGALDLIAGYSADNRQQVQEELVKAWEYFDADEYAQRVLADAPLDYGRLIVREPRLLPSARHLTRLVRLSAISDRPLASLSFLRDLDQPIATLFVNHLQSGDLRLLSRCAASLQYLLIHTNVAIEDLAPLSKLPKLLSLDLKAPAVTDLEFVRELPVLHTLSISNVAAADLTPLRAQNALTSFSLDDGPAISDLDVLPRLEALTQLSLKRSALTPGLADVVHRAPLLKDLHLNYSPWVDDIRPLTSLALESLTLWGCRGITDFTPLTELTKLTYLDLEDTNIDDLQPLAGLAHLDTLWLRDCANVTDLGPLAGLSRLRKLYIGGVAPDIDLAPLADLPRLNVKAAVGQKVRNAKALRKKLRTF